MFNIIGVNLLFGQIHNDEFICFKENNKQPSEIRIRTLQSGVLLKTIPFKGNSGVLEIHDCYGDRFSESLQIDFKRMKKIEEKLITKEQELDKREKELNRREKKLNKREKN
jgi:hypothetical protein